MAGYRRITVALHVRTKRTNLFVTINDFEKTLCQYSLGNLVYTKFDDKIRKFSHLIKRSETALFETSYMLFRTFESIKKQNKAQELRVQLCLHSFNAKIAYIVDKLVKWGVEIEQISDYGTFSHNGCYKRKKKRR